MKSRSEDVVKTQRVGIEVMRNTLSFILICLAGCFAGGSLVVSAFLVFAAALLQYDKIEAEINKISR